MPKIDAYLTFDGTCAEAMRFYEKTLGGTMEKFITVAESPMCEQMPPGSGDRIMHALLNLDGRYLMASDAMVGQPYDGIKGVSLVLTYDSVEEAKRIFDALVVGGTVTMPMDKTFWAESFGMLVDRFGTAWMINGVLLDY